MATNLYNKDSIQSLNPREFCRLRPGVYCGSTVYSTQLLQEVFANSLDEHCIGHGNTIIVNINNDICEVIDGGQGFLINEIRPEDGKSIFEASLSVMNTSGKYNSETGVYEGTSLGLNGMGSKLTNFLAHWMKATTHRDGKYETLWFKEGIFEKREVGEWPDKNSSGTSIQWQPSEEFFTHTEVEINKIKSLFKSIVCLCPGLTILLTVDGQQEKYYSENGLNDLVDKQTKSEEIINHRLNYKNQIGKSKIDLVLTYTSNYNSTIIPYVNTGLTESGPHITQFKTIITREMNKFFKDKGYLKETEDNLSGDDIQEGLFLIFNLTSPEVKYDAQVKSRIVGIECKDIMASFSEALVNWLKVNEKEIKIIAEKAILARTAREKARKAREAVRENKERKRRKVINPDKLKDAEHLGQNSVLLCVEGNSAAASMAVSRDTSKYGILALRGKPINLLTNSKDKIDKNAEIQLLISALGITPGAYDAKDLRYGTVAIASDSDSDGYHVGLLIAAALEVLCPEFIQEGRLCWLRSPLYIVKNGKKEEYYYTDEEMNAVRDNIKGEVQRCKGLGTLSAAQAKASMFNDSNQKLDVLEYTPEAITMLKDLLGESITKRKKYIFDNLDFSQIRE